MCRPTTVQRLQSLRQMTIPFLNKPQFCRFLQPLYSLTGGMQPLKSLIIFQRKVNFIPVSCDNFVIATVAQICKVPFCNIPSIYVAAIIPLRDEVAAKIPHQDFKKGQLYMCLKFEPCMCHIQGAVQLIRIVQNLAANSVAAKFPRTLSALYTHLEAPNDILKGTTKILNRFPTR